RGPEGRLPAAGSGRPARARAPGVGAKRRAGRLRRRIHLPAGSGDGAHRRDARRGSGARARSLPRHLHRAGVGPGRVGRGPGFRRLRPRPAEGVIVRWGLEELPGVLDDVGVERVLLVAGPRWDALEIPAAARWSEIPSDRISVPPEVDGIL